MTNAHHEHIYAAGSAWRHFFLCRASGFRSALASHYYECRRTLFQDGFGRWLRDTERELRVFWPVVPYAVSHAQISDRRDEGCTGMDDTGVRYLRRRFREGLRVLDERFGFGLDEDSGQCARALYKKRVIKRATSLRVFIFQVCHDPLP